MKEAAIWKADVRLHAMGRAISDLAAPSKPMEFASDWYVFITAANGIYEVLKRGAGYEHVRKGSEKLTASQQLVKNMITYCDDDPLLKYIYEARNDEEHGLVRSVENRPAIFETFIPMNSGDGMVSFTVDTDENGFVSSRDFASSFASGVVATHKVEHRMVLAPVSDRRGRKYMPPTRHEGKELADRSPLAIAHLIHDYMVKLVAAARALVESPAH